MKTNWAFMAVLAPDSSRLGRWERPVRLGLAMFSAFTAVAFAWRLWVVLSVAVGSVVGVDRGIYKEAALRWADGGFWYYPDQLAGPYTIIQGHVLYPPTALAWLVPAAYLPDALWWGIPICVISGIVWHHRPSIWAWPAIGLCPSTFWSDRDEHPPAAIADADQRERAKRRLQQQECERWPPDGSERREHRDPEAGIARRDDLDSLASLPMWIDYVHVLLNGRGPLAVP